MKCQNFQRKRLTSDALISCILRYVHENQYVRNIIKILFLTAFSHILWNFSIEEEEEESVYCENHEI